jgi:hypothetical protein
MEKKKGGMNDNDRKTQDRGWRSALTYSHRVGQMFRHANIFHAARSFKIASFSSLVASSPKQAFAYVRANGVNPLIPVSSMSAAISSFEIGAIFLVNYKQPMNERQNHRQTQRPKMKNAP